MKEHVLKKIRGQLYSAEGAMKHVKLDRHDVMSVPGRAEDGSDTAWFVIDRKRWPRTSGEYVGDGDGAWLRARLTARYRNKVERTR